MINPRVMFARLSLYEDGGLLAELQVKRTLVNEIKKKHPLDVSLLPRIKQIGEEHSGPYAMHLGGNKMYHDLKELYWWLGLKLEPIKIPQWKWEQVTMDFVTGLPATPTKKDSIWVIVDRLPKSARFLPILTGYSLQKLARFQSGSLRSLLAPKD
ncbi:uncharacterized protein LOC105781414 [Gossypium raimondii]|uniref:uncharacterized protein LOC105781414 n=1 Tax=Gossypium raimondii TaxID=29730 RepID=UPI00063AA95E|nr:uncharacterized protein LOC105781414 [Gossypium raimondii]